VIGYLLIVDTKFKIKRFDWFILSLSVIVILFTFMEDSINIILTGKGNLAEVRPTKFDWVLYLISLLVWILTTFKIFHPTMKNIEQS
jgi:hypothetical protein